MQHRVAASQRCLPRGCSICHGTSQLPRYCDARHRRPAFPMGRAVRSKHGLSAVPARRFSDPILPGHPRRKCRKERPRFNVCHRSMRDVQLQSICRRALIVSGIALRSLHPQMRTGSCCEAASNTKFPLGAPDCSVRCLLKAQPSGKLLCESWPGRRLSEIPVHRLAFPANELR